MDPMNVLISLHHGYGLGDATQMSAVLRHLAKYRPDWRIDYQAEEGKHQVGRGIVANTFAYGEPYPSSHYSAEAQLLLFDSWANWGDRPNTRVSSVLHERFGLGWDPECGRYRVDVSSEAMQETRAFLLLLRKPRKGVFPLVAIHYQGDSSPERKNLTHAQASAICDEVEGTVYTPMVLDWRGTSPLPAGGAVRSINKLTAAKWGASAEYNCAVIRQCAAFVGIDSGPSKCASSTDTPALVVWVGHHPAPFHDPAPNTTHLVPVGYHGLEPVCNDAGVMRFFEKNYRVRYYERDPVKEVGNWLREVLR